MGSLDNSPEKIIVGNCVSCGGLVRIPFAASPTSLVRCPHCGESFKLATVLDRSVPSLEVVEEEPVLSFIKPSPPQVTGRINLDSSGQDPDREPGTKFEVSPILKKGAKKKRRKKKRRGRTSSKPQESRPANPWAPDVRANNVEGLSSSTGLEEASQSDTAIEELPTEIDETSFPVSREQPRRRNVEAGNAGKRTTEDSAARQRRQRPVRRRTNASSGSGLEILKVLIGALLALPVAQLLIWWVFGKDPLNLGPTVSGVIPAVVPVDLQEATEDQSEAPSGEPADEEIGDLPVPDDA